MMAMLLLMHWCTDTGADAMMLLLMLMHWCCCWWLQWHFHRESCFLSSGCLLFSRRQNLQIHKSQVTFHPVSDAQCLQCSPVTCANSPIERFLNLHKLRTNNKTKPTAIYGTCTLYIMSKYDKSIVIIKTNQICILPGSSQYRWLLSHIKHDWLCQAY